MGSPVVHFEVVGRDAEALRAFYREAFGWEIGPPVGGVGTPDYTIVKPNEHAGIEGGIGKAPDGYDGHATFYVGVPNADAAVRTIQSLGGTVMVGPAEVPGGPIIAVVKDPEGHTFGIVQTEA
jgi:hypothetical protein